MIAILGKAGDRAVLHSQREADVGLRLLASLLKNKEIINPRLEIFSLGRQ